MNTIAKDDKPKRGRKPGTVTPVAADYLNGLSPHARAEEKRQLVLTWLYRWGYTSGPVMAMVSGAKQPIAGKLEKLGLVTATRTEAGGAMRGVPTHYYTLTEFGLQEAERMTMTLCRYPEIDPYRVNQQQIRHYLLAQQATISALSAGMAVDYLTERMIDQEGDKTGIKRPDVVWVLPNNTGSMGVEIELSAKWDRRLDELVLGIIRSLQKGKESPARFQRVAIVTDSPAIKRRYEEAMKPGAPLSLWRKNSRHHWEVEDTVLVPAWLVDRMDFVLLER